MPNSSMLVLPTMLAPASLRNVTTDASNGDVKLRCSEEHRQKVPADVFGCAQACWKSMSFSIPWCRCCP